VWTEAEQQVLEQAARSLVRGKFPNLSAAASSCREELVKLRRRRPETSAGVARGLTGISDRLGRRARALGWTWASVRWNPAERRVVDGYARRLASGRYETVREASRACYEELAQLHARLSDARPDWRTTLPLRSYKTVHTYLLRWSKALGRKTVGRWTREQDVIVVRYARALARREYLTVKAALPGCWQELAAAGLTLGRTQAGLAARLLLKAGKLGLEQRRHRWPEPELRIIRGT
jgi:hypothetical protein